MYIEVVTIANDFELSAPSFPFFNSHVILPDLRPPNHSRNLPCPQIQPEDPRLQSGLVEGLAKGVDTVCWAKQAAVPSGHTVHQ